MTRYAEVVVTLPVEGRFHYAIPAELEGALAIGHRVLVRFGPRRVTGFVLGFSDEVPPAIEDKVRPILERLDEEPLVPNDVLALAAFAAEYYLATPGEVLKLALPPGITAASKARYAITAAGRHWMELGTDRLANGARITTGERRLLEGATKSTGVKLAGAPAKAVAALEALGLITRKERVGAKKLDPKAASPAGAARSSFAPESAPAPTAEQGRALGAILERIDAETGGAFLLHGVTASGKTEVYLGAISHTRARGHGAIVLVPEIALTPQLEARFRSRFGDDVVVLHSALTDAERRRRWQKLRRGEAHIALGPRSAVWAPVHDVRVIVVDEEHDPSFKQGSDVRYNGRDLALTRAHHAKGVAILGSATPSLESLQAARAGKLIELRLRERVGGRPMPAVELVDLGRERESTSGEPRVLTRVLADRLRSVVSARGQAILFLNRRGFNTVVFCEDCGAARRCSACDVSLTHHKHAGALVCHYCGHVERLDAPCKECRGTAMQPFGVGTQRVAEAVAAEVPEARVLRLDRDVTAHVGELDRTLETFRRGDADVLVGTQMVAKGHDFPGVMLVGIVLADASLAFPDFRAAERTFQLVTQVAGRAGRAGDPGHVVVQTFQPQHYALQCALRHDTEAFFEIEAESRRHASYPPFSRIGLVRFESKDRARLSQAAEAARRAIDRVPGGDLRWRGPVAAPIGKIRDRYREMLIVFAPTPARLVGAMRRMRAELEEVAKHVAVIYDVDPVDLL